ncbi:MAG: carbohydrate porin, partial [Synechococcaceae cyanobacterium]|nr:carbohydrate porin [Synechococcaceae cyanobacterium]
MPDAERINGILNNLQAEFDAELAILRGRVDRLEANVAELEASQFSTTTKLSGTPLIRGINQQRQRQGQQELQLISGIAQQRAKPYVTKALATNVSTGKCGHNAQEFETYRRSTRDDANRLVGEVCGHVPESDPNQAARKTVDQWFKSPAHRSILFEDGTIVHLYCDSAQKGKSTYSICLTYQASMAGREVDGLEAGPKQLEGSQFSTTTKLKGSTQFELGGYGEKTRLD